MLWIVYYILPVLQGIAFLVFVNMIRWWVRESRLHYRLKNRCIRLKDFSSYSLVAMRSKKRTFARMGILLGCIAFALRLLIAFQIQFISLQSASVLTVTVTTLIISGCALLNYSAILSVLNPPRRI